MDTLSAFRAKRLTQPCEMSFLFGSVNHHAQLFRKLYAHPDGATDVRGLFVKQLSEDFALLGGGLSGMLPTKFVTSVDVVKWFYILTATSQNSVTIQRKSSVPSHWDLYHART